VCVCVEDITVFLSTMAAQQFVADGTWKEITAERRNKNHVSDIITKSLFLLLGRSRRRARLLYGT
jgi:hypothetical protein